MIVSSKCEKWMFLKWNSIVTNQQKTKSSILTAPNKVTTWKKNRWYKITLPQKTRLFYIIRGGNFCTSMLAYRSSHYFMGQSSYGVTNSKIYELSHFCGTFQWVNNNKNKQIYIHINIIIQRKTNNRNLLLCKCDFWERILAFFSTNSTWSNTINQATSLCLVYKNTHPPTHTRLHRVLCVNKSF